MRWYRQFLQMFHKYLKAHIISQHRSASILKKRFFFVKSKIRLPQEKKIQKELFSTWSGKTRAKNLVFSCIRVKYLRSMLKFWFEKLIYVFYSLVKKILQNIFSRLLTRKFVLQSFLHKWNSEYIRKSTFQNKILA